jgi:hypothetical protein
MAAILQPIRRCKGLAAEQLDELDEQITDYISYCDEKIDDQLNSGLEMKEIFARRKLPTGRYRCHSPPHGDHPGVGNLLRLHNHSSGPATEYGGELHSGVPRVRRRLAAQEKHHIFNEVGPLCRDVREIIHIFLWSGKTSPSPQFTCRTHNVAKKVLQHLWKFQKDEGGADGRRPISVYVLEG